MEDLRSWRNSWTKPPKEFLNEIPGNFPLEFQTDFFCFSNVSEIFSLLTSFAKPVQAPIFNMVQNFGPKLLWAKCEVVLTFGFNAFNVFAFNIEH